MLSFIMAPHVGQMERVGAKLRSHTGHFIGVSQELVLRIREQF
jgi:hypothetical protein